MTMIKSILLPFNNVLPTAVAINAARTLGQQFESYVEGVFCRQLLPVIAGEGITLPGDYLAEFEEEGRRQGEEARDVFFQLIGEVDIPEADLEDATVGLRAGWTEMVGTGTGGVAEYARLFDLSIIARPDDELAVEWKSTIEALLFESGRPILLVGDEVPSVVGDRVVVAWNGSVEAARSVVMSEALLANPSEVVVVTVAGATVPGPSGKQLVAQMCARNINARAETIERGETTVGGALLDYAEDFDADLLVKSAFTQSRFRQWVFGGATKEIISTASIPVLMCH
jgi:nucleotide-binding universal stress UspA family protein